MKNLISALLLLCLAGCSTSPSKSELDAEVRRLCAIDGGIKVYETVALPQEKFNQWGQVNFYKPLQGERALGPEYIFQETTIYPQPNSPLMRRVKYQILRKIDGKVIGESVSYHRVGGDMQGPWHESSFRCPQEAGDVQLLTRVFVRQNSGGMK